MNKKTVLALSLLMLNPLCASDAYASHWSNQLEGATPTAGSGIYLSGVAMEECRAAIGSGLFLASMPMRGVHHPDGKLALSAFMPQLVAADGVTRNLGRMLAICQVAPGVIDEVSAVVPKAGEALAPLRASFKAWSQSFEAILHSEPPEVLALAHLSPKPTVVKEIKQSRDAWVLRLQTTEPLRVIVSPDVAAASARDQAEAEAEARVAQVQYSSVSDAAYEEQLRHALAASEEHPGAAAACALDTSTTGSAAAATDEDEAFRLAMEMSMRDGAAPGRDAGATDEDEALRLAMELSMRDSAAPGRDATEDVFEDLPLTERIPAHMLPDFHEALGGDRGAGARLRNAIHAARDSGDTNPVYDAVLALFD